MNTSVRYLRSATCYAEAPNLWINVGESPFAYRDLGLQGGVPVILLNHWGAVLDNFDPRIVDGLATRHHVIATNYRVSAPQAVRPL